MQIPCRGVPERSGEDASSPDNCCHSGTKVSPSAPGGHFLPETVAFRGQSASGGKFFPERYLFWGQKYLSQHPEGISSRKLLPFGDKVPPGVSFSRKDTSFGDKSISLSTPRAFPPGNRSHSGIKCLPGEGSSRKDTSFGDKSISPRTPRAFPPENRNHLGTKCLPGEGFSRKDTSFGDKSIPPCITPCGKQCFCCF